MYYKKEGIRTDKNGKIGLIVRYINMLSSDGDRPTITVDLLRTAIVRASMEWGSILTSESSKKNYIRTLEDLSILELANKSAYYFDQHAWSEDRPAISAKRQLTMNQSLAVDLLAAGLGDSETARQIGVSRVTVYRWRTGHESFMIELEAAMKERAAPVQEAVR